MLETKVAIVDPDVRRRCSVARYFYEHARHVEPFESPSEARASWPRTGLLLICDERSNVEETFEAMLDEGYWVPTIIYSPDPDPSRIVDAVLLGAMDYLPWPFTTSLLQSRLELLDRRRHSFAAHRRKTTRAQRLVGHLSARERQVLFSLAKGASNKSIAHDLSISPRTVEIHRANMMGKLGASHVSEAITVALYAHFQGLDEEIEVRPALL